tara:strand:- start:659 stop:871 length:213 start_codon:yes stop_codon:yes gene_type:complete
MNNTGGPAFPQTYIDKEYNPYTIDTTSIALRDYFAAKAMQGILYAGLEPVETAKHAYTMADAMLKAREQK